MSTRDSVYGLVAENTFTDGKYLYLPISMRYNKKTNKNKQRCLFWTNLDEIRSVPAKVANFHGGYYVFRCRWSTWNSCHIFSSIGGNSSQTLGTLPENHTRCPESRNSKIHEKKKLDQMKTNYWCRKCFFFRMFFLPMFFFSSSNALSWRKKLEKYGTVLPIERSQTNT